MLPFAAMILAAMVVMHAVMFVGDVRVEPFRFSESRVYMAMTAPGD